MKNVRIVAALSVALVVLIIIVNVAATLWRPGAVGAPPGPQPPQANKPAVALPNSTPIAVGERLVVNVSGVPEAVAQCGVFAMGADVPPVAAERVKEGVFVFERRIPAGAQVLALANLGKRDLGWPGRAVVNIHVSRFVTPAAHEASPLLLDLKQTEYLTVHATDAQGQPILDAAVTVDFTGDAEAMNWLSLLDVAGIKSPETWLRGTEADAPQVPLLRQGTKVRVSAQSHGRFGTSPWFVVEQSGTVEITLADARTFVEIEVRDPNDRPVPLLPLSYVIVRTVGGARVRAGPTVTDENGSCRFHIHEEGVGLEISIASEVWYLPERVAKFNVEKTPQRLTVRPAIAISLEIHFEDQQQYRGPLSVQSLPSEAFSADFSAPGEPRDYHGPRGTRPKPDPAGVYRIAGVPGDLDLECRAVPQRAGFGDLSHIITAAELKPGAHYVLSIPRARPRQPSAKLIFLGDWETLGRSTVQVIQMSPYYFCSSYDLRFQKETRLLYPGEYRVVLVGGAWAWESQTLVLAAGEERKVELPCIKSASVTAAVRSETGQPLRGAALCFGLAQWADFPAIPQAGWLAASDATGKATLEGCPAGQVELRIEADGYEPEVVSATLISGVVTDIGVISLRPARGEIRITIKNFEKIAKLEPRADLVVAGGRNGGRRGPRVADSSEVVFRGLPLGRTYSSAIGPKVGRSWKMLNDMKLTESEPTLSIEVDAETFDFDK